MAVEYKVLGQAAPAATTETVLYTAASQTVVSSILITNRSSTDRTFRISVAVAGAATSNEQYVAYDTLIEGGAIFEVTTGITLGASDVVRCYASSADLSFNASGKIIT